MLNELYNRLKEQDRFSDVFKPISKEEMKKRDREKWGHSDYDNCRAYEADVKGRFILTYDKQESTTQSSSGGGEVLIPPVGLSGSYSWPDFEEEGDKKIAELLGKAIEDSYNFGEEPQIERLFLNLSASNLNLRKIPDEFDKDRDNGFEIIEGVFSGTAIMVGEEEIDESIIKDTIIEYMAISNEEGMWGEWGGKGGMKINNVQVTNLKVIEREDMWKSLAKYTHIADVEGEGEEEDGEEKRKMIDKVLKDGRCTLNPDGSYSCKGDVDFGSKGLRRIPVKFKEVKGDFDCSFNRIETLEGSPEEVGGDFDCSSNELTSLEGLSKKVGGYIDIEDTPIAEELGIDRIKGSELHRYI